MGSIMEENFTKLKFVLSEYQYRLYADLVSILG